MDLPSKIDNSDLNFHSDRGGYRLASNHLSLLNNVSAQLVALRHARNYFAPRLAPDFNVFDFIQTDELRLSQIIGWLLDPKGTHAQGDAFLLEFASKFVPTLEGLDTLTAQIKLEAACGDQRRIDILLDMGRVGLAIENKPYANDQDGQLRHYLNYLSRFEQSSLLYLTGTSDRLPADHSLSLEERTEAASTGQLVLMSYADLIPWLEACRGKASSERVRVFLDDFQNFILSRFEGMNDMTEQAMLIEQILRDKQTIEAAAQVANGWREAQRSLITILNNQIKAALPDDWRINGELTSKAYSYIELTAPSSAPWAFRVGFDGGNFKSFVYGVAHPKTTKSNLKNMLAELNSALGAGSNKAPTDDWAWWRYTSPLDPLLAYEVHWENNPEPWQDIADGVIANAIISAGRSVLEQVRPS